MLFFKNTKRLFISYSRQNSHLVRPIVEIVRATGCEVFYDVDSIAAGKKWKLELSKAISDADVVLVFWSEDSAKSKEVKKEYTQAAELGKDIIPILVDDTPLNTVLSDYQYIDLQYALPGYTWISTAKSYSEDILKALGFKSLEKDIRNPYKICVLIFDNGVVKLKAQEMVLSLRQNGFTVTLLQEDLNSEWLSASFHQTMEKSGIVLLLASIEHLSLSRSGSYLNLYLYRSLTKGILVPMMIGRKKDEEYLDEDIIAYKDRHKFIKQLAKWKLETAAAPSLVSIFSYIQHLTIGANRS